MQSDLSLDDDEELALGDDDDEELTITDDEDELALGEDDDLVLDGGSDITRGAGDTGINLAAPADSGLNLEEEPLDLAGSSVSSLELPEDDDIIDLDSHADPDDATQLKADETFDLAPSSGLEMDDDDSGSQVIALEDSEAFSDNNAMLEEQPLGGGGGISLDKAPEAAPQPTPGEALDEALGNYEENAVTTPALPDVERAGPLPEMPYSIWNVLSLMLIFMILGATGLLMVDVVRNMWSWQGTYSATSPLMEFAVNVLDLK